MSDLLKETILYKKITSRIYDDGEPFCRHEVTEEEVNAIEIPKNATYGDVIMQVLKSAGDYYEHKEFANTIYVYDARAPRLANCTIDKRLWDTPFQRWKKV